MTKRQRTIADRNATGWMHVYGQVYGGWAGGDDISKEMRKLGQALGLASDPA